MAGWPFKGRVSQDTCSDTRQRLQVRMALSPEKAAGYLDVPGPSLDIDKKSGSTVEIKSISTVGAKPGCFPTFSNTTQKITTQPGCQTKKPFTPGQQWATTPTIAVSAAQSSRILLTFSIAQQNFATTVLTLRM
jgi:hypothetical protein